VIWLPTATASSVAPAVEAVAVTVSDWLRDTLLLSEVEVPVLVVVKSPVTWLPVAVEVAVLVVVVVASDDCDWFVSAWVTVAVERAIAVVAYWPVSELPVSVLVRESVPTVVTVCDCVWLALVCDAVLSPVLVASAV
jgi:hypothetical protein